MWITCTAITIRLNSTENRTNMYQFLNSWNLIIFSGINYLFLAFQSLIILTATPLAGYRQTISQTQSGSYALNRIRAANWEYY
jgi:hypothetical protein